MAMYKLVVGRSSDGFRCFMTARCNCRSSVRHYSELRTTGDNNELNIQKLLKRKYVYEDYITPAPTLLLTRALEDYLPRYRKRKLFQPRWVHLGQQHLFFRPHLSAHELCDDGTDIKFLPGPADIWKYRLWAGGSVFSHSMLTPGLMNPNLFGLVERASDVRVVQRTGGVEKVFVTIERKFLGPIDEDWKSSMTASAPDDTRPSNQRSEFITETENICFLREPPQSLKTDRVLKPPVDPMFAHTTIPRRGLLFQFSALTFNAHSIHIDREFAQQEYGAKDLVVHGPLTQVLMIEFLRRCLHNVQANTNVAIIPRSIEYTNLRPLYIDEPLTLCCKPLTERDAIHAEKVKKWQVWIQTGKAESASLAVRATINIDLLTRDEFHLILNSNKERSDIQNSNPKPTTKYLELDSESKFNSGGFGI